MKIAPLPALKIRQSEIVKVKPQLREIDEKQSSIALSSQKRMAPVGTLATPTAQEWIPLDRIKFPTKKPSKKLKISKS